MYTKNNFPSIFCTVNYEEEEKYYNFGVRSACPSSFRSSPLKRLTGAK